MILAMVMDKKQDVGNIILLALGAIALVWAIYIIISLIIDYNQDKKKVEELIDEKKTNNASQKRAFSQSANSNLSTALQNNMYLQSNNSNVNAVPQSNMYSQGYSTNMNTVPQSNMYSQGHSTNVNVTPQSNMYLQENNTSMNVASQNKETNMNSQCFLKLDIDSVLNQESKQVTDYEVPAMNMQPAYANAYAPSGGMTQCPTDTSTPYSQGFYATSNHFTDTGRSGLIGEYTNMETNCGNFVIIKSVISTETREELELI